MHRFVCLLLGGAAFAQSYGAGSTDLTFANPTTQGSPQLDATVWYPAASPGRNVPLLPRSGGYPVLVFLHGLNVLGSGYGALGQQFAEHGYVAVLGNTARSSAVTQIDDGIAMFAALVQANGASGSFLHGALDMNRAGLSGHSMGGSTTTSVLAANPGYRAGFCFAPGIAPAAAQVDVPIGICHGTGDQVLDWQTFGLALYQNLTAVRELKFFHLLDQDCTHGNVAGYVQLTQVDRDVFAATSRVAIGFFDRFLKDDDAALEACIGPTARSEARLVRLDVEIRAPQLWLFGSAAIGHSAAFRTAAAPGLAALFCAAAAAQWPSPFGDVLLDPATLTLAAVGAAGQDSLWLSMLAVPNDAGLIGLRLPFQGIGSDHLGALRTTNRCELAIVP